MTDANGLNSVMASWRRRKVLRPVLLVIACVLTSCAFHLRAADLKSLPGHIPAAVSQLLPKGSVPGSREMRLAVGVQMRDQPGLEKFVADVSNPASPNYRHYLSLEEVTARF